MAKYIVPKTLYKLTGLNKKSIFINPMYLLRLSVYTYTTDNVETGDTWVPKTT